MSTWQGLLAAFQVLKELIDGAKWLAQWVNENKDEKWFQESAALFSDLRKAKTPDEKKLAAERLRDLIRKL
jgi:hypothetical protein